MRTADNTFGPSIVKYTEDSQIPFGSTKIIPKFESLFCLYFDIFSNQRKCTSKEDTETTANLFSAIFDS